MAISFLDNLNIKKKAPNVERDLFDTVEDMVAWSENYLPDVFECNVKATGKRYRFNISNSIDPTLGRWREVSGGDTDLSNYYDKSETDTLLDDKADKGDFDTVSQTVEKLDGNSETEGSVRYLDAAALEESKGYTDEQIEKINKKKSISCDAKPVYNSEAVPPTITYVKNGEEHTIPADEIWFYYMAENDMNQDNIISMNEIGLAQTIWIDGEDFTIMSFGLDMSEYVNKNNDVTSEYTGEELDTSKVPDIKALQLLEKKVMDKMDEGASASDISYENERYPAQTDVKKSLDAIWSRLDYVEPKIESFAMSPATTDYEIGQEITELDFSWTYNKEVTSQSLTDVTISDVSDRTGKWTGSLKTSKTFTLTCGDGQKSASATKTVSFKNKVYYGSASIPSEFDSAFILSLEKKQFATAKKGSYSMTVGSDEYGFISFPASFGNLATVWIGGFEVTVEACGNIAFTNASGGVVTYSIYRTKRSGLGPITMEVK